MPRAKKTDKFHFYLPKKTGYWKDKILLSVNHGYEGDQEAITLEDLNKFIEEKGFDPSKVKISSSFTTTIDVEQKP